MKNEFSFITRFAFVLIDESNEANETIFQPWLWVARDASAIAATANDAQSAG